MTRNSTAEEKTKRRSKVFGLRHKASHDPRAAALAALYAVLYEGADSQAALDAALRSVDLVPTDRRLCTELLYGVLRWYLRLDSLVCARLKNPEKLPVEMRLALLSALYELSALRIPAHATVNWTVQHVRNRFGAGLAGVANGVLRALQRERVRLLPASFPSPAFFMAEKGAVQGVRGSALPDGSSVAPAETFFSDDITLAAEKSASDDVALSAAYAMPQWIVRMWREQYGPEAAQNLLLASQLPAPVGVRLNMHRDGWEDLLGEVLAFAPDLAEHPEPESDAAGTGAASQQAKGKNRNLAYRVGQCALAFSGSLPWMLREPVKDGRASRQSAASYEALFTLEPQTWPGPLWDACAGRGGKSLALIESGIPVALASDASPKRLLSLPEEFSRLFPDTVPAMPALCAASAGEVADMLETGVIQERLLPVSGAGEDVSGAAGPFPELFGTILVDAPCSGLGTLARRPEIRIRRTPEDCKALVAVQKAILDTVWGRLAPGGLLVYVTCTKNMEENQLQVEDFLKRQTGAVLEAQFETSPDSPLGEFFYSARIQKA